METRANGRHAVDPQTARAPSSTGVNVSAEPAKPTTPVQGVEAQQNGRVLFRGDVDQMRSMLEQSGTPPGFLKLENGNPVGMSWPRSYREQVASALNYRDADPKATNVASADANQPSAGESTPAQSFAAEPFRNGTKVLYRGDIADMRQRLSDAGLPAGMRYAQDGKDVGLYFPASMRYQVDSVLAPNEARPAGSTSKTDAQPSGTQGTLFSRGEVGNGADDLVTGLRLLASHSEAFQHPVSNAKTLEGVFKDTEGAHGMTAQEDSYVASLNN